MSKKIHAERMNKVIQFIEHNLDTEISVHQLSKIACYSEFHFHRLFRSFVGESIYAYKKRLLLERSVKHLLYSNDSITEIAFKCGYDNPSSFNKAFKANFSYTPSQVRKQMVSVDTTKIKLNINQSIDMKPEIKIIDDINVICAREVGNYVESAPKAWNRIMQFADSHQLMNKDVRMIGIPHDDPSVTDANNIRYDACLDIDVSINEEDNLIKYTISGGKYAKFLHQGAYENLDQSYSYIFNEWLPESNYKLRDEPCFDIYLNNDSKETKPENLTTEIYIPIE